VELNIDVDPVHGPADSGDLATDLAGLFVELGEVARDHGTGVLITIDELHYVKLATLEALVMGLHRATQLALPIPVAGAGLPSLATLTGEPKSYAERIFPFPVIGSLTGDQPLEALEVPAADEEVRWAPEALTRVVEVTGGYPYFLQEFGKQAWAMAELCPGPVRSVEVAELLGKKATALGPTRDGLLKKALCFSPRWGEIDFTVPMFDAFM